MGSPGRIAGLLAVSLVSLSSAFLLMLASCGGGTDPQSGAVLPAQTSTGGRASALGTAHAGTVGHLFVPDLAHGSVLAVPTLEPDSGMVLPGDSISTRAGVGNNVQIDLGRDELYVIGGHDVNVYANASTLATGATPTRSFPLPSTLKTPRTLFLDTSNDVLYVGGASASGEGLIMAYSAAHTLKGISAVPARAMTLAGGVSFFTLDVLRQKLYVVNSAAGVHVFANADNASGRLVATATIPVLGSGLAVDSARDRLYVCDIFAGLILVDQASTAAPVVTATLSLDDARHVAVDAASDRLYVSAASNLYVIDNASELTPATTLGAPSFARAAGAAFGALALR